MFIFFIFLKGGYMMHRSIEVDGRYLDDIEVDSNEARRERGLKYRGMGGLVVWLFGCLVE
jgi:uncharacterized protein YgiB involved in biofilm formation